MSVEPGTLADVASIIAGFGSAMILFRIQREVEMRAKGERVWLPLADVLLVLVTLSSLLAVVVPILAGIATRGPAAVASAAAVAVAGYIPAVLAHYRIVFGASRTGPRDNPEPLELVFVVGTIISAIGVGIWVFQKN